MDQLAEKYRGKAAFFLIYGPEAHPNGHDWTVKDGEGHEPIGLVASYAERQALARSLRARKQLKRIILVDNIEEPCTRDRFLPVPGLNNPIVVVGANGCFAYAREAVDLASVNEFLEQYLRARD
jgi:hypothetical protein